jgi:predicted ATPase/DNA-binding SARP family transcriptional activator
VANTGVDAARVQVLGPVRAWSPTGWVDVPGVNGKALIVSLVLAKGQVVSVPSLIDDIWQDDPPRNARAALQTLVSRVRAIAGDELIESVAGGYRLGTDAVDLWSFDAERRGEPGADLGETELAARLRETAHGVRRRALEARVTDALTGGAPADALDAARALADAAPYDEHARQLLMTALAAAGRRGEALHAFAEFKQRLGDELGARPGPELVALNAQLLRGPDEVSIRPTGESTSGEAAAPAGRLTRSVNGDRGTHTGALTIGLRAAPNQLIGRDADIAALEELMAGSRLTTILGPGGLGKTRLAQELAHRAARRTPGVVVVELAGIRESDDVPLAVAATLGIGEVGAARVSLRDPIMLLEVRTRIRAALSERATLLVLDNCEHVIEGAAYLVDQVLAEIPTVRVLATSRSPLQLGSERVYPLEPLSASTAGRVADPLDESRPDAAAYGPAVALFMERARAARPGAALPLDAVARLCEHLDGLPLAIELAAARIRSMSVDEIERRLSNRFALLRGGDRSAPERHRTLIAVIDWSWNLLTESERRLLRRLSSFPDGFTAEAAAAVAEAHDEVGRAAASDDLDALVLQSLVSVSEGPAGLRYRMLETVREFGDMALVDAGEDGRVAAARARWARAFAVDVLAAMPTARQGAMIRALAADHDNLVAVLRAAGEAHDADTVVPVFGALLFHWMIRNQFREALSFAPTIAATVTAPTLPADAPDAAAICLMFAAIMGVAGSRMPHKGARGAPGDAPTARNGQALPPEFEGIVVSPPGAMLRAGLRAAVRLRRLVGTGAVSPWLAAVIQLLIGAVRDQAFALVQLDRMRRGDDEATRVIAELFSSFLVENLGDLDAAERHGMTAWQDATRLGLDWMAGQAAQSLAQLASQENRAEDALAWIERGRERLVTIGAVEEIVQAEWIAAVNRLKLGRGDDVAEVFERFAREHEHGDDLDAFDLRAIGLSGLAELAAAEGRDDDAVQLYREAARVFGPNPAAVARGGWFLISAAAGVAASVYFDRMDDDGLTLARALRASARIAMRGRGGPRSGPEAMDRPVSGAAGLGVALWLLGTSDETDARRRVAAELLALAERLRSRQDLPMLVRERAVRFARGVVDASVLSNARERVAALPDLDACATRLDELLRTTRL